MATLSPPVTVHVPQTGRDGGGSLPPVFGGGGDGGRSDSDGSPDYTARLRRARLGLAVAIAPIVMLFVSFTSAYIVRKGLPTLDEKTNTYVRDWTPVNLPIALLLVNTGLLLLSSISAELARRQITREAAVASVGSIPGVSLGPGKGFPWLGITVVLGGGFLTGQWFAWHLLAERGFYLATSASSAFVYLLTATHAVHLMGGMLVLVYAAIVSLLHKPVEARRIVVDVTAWYWHFMFLLWVYILALLWFV
ncbi:MAG: heme-copper oxidase subunit III [Terriglobales bacterium]